MQHQENQNINTTAIRSVSRSISIGIFKFVSTVLVSMKFKIKKVICSRAKLNHHGAKTNYLICTNDTKSKKLFNSLTDVIRKNIFSSKSANLPETYKKIILQSLP